jgi:hypothetical protein
MTVKTFKCLSLLLSATLISSCGSDDDNGPRLQGVFPVEFIHTSDVESFSENRSIRLSYNNQNQIGEIEIEDSAGLATNIALSYDNGLVDEISSTNRFGDATYTFTYSNGIITGIVYNDGEESRFPVSHNNIANTYTFSNEGDAFVLDLNDDGYLELITTPFGTTELFFNENATGPFLNVTPQPALYIVMMLSRPDRFYFFSPFELVRWDTGVTREVINNRDANGNLNAVVYENSNNGAVMGRILIAYENRTL